MVRLTEEKILREDIDAIREAIRISWIELDRMVFTLRQKQELCDSVGVLIRDLADLLARLMSKSPEGLKRRGR